MKVRIIEVILRDGFGTMTFHIRSWKIQEGCLFCYGVENQEVTVFPLSSIVGFYERAKEQQENL